MISEKFLGGSGNFVYWFGTVVSNKDPLRLGRCRCRILGWHPQNEDDVPNDDLPWAIPVLPLNNAAISGVGQTPIGPVQGTRVFGFFADGTHAQMPIMLGTIPGVHKVPTDEERTVDPRLVYPLKKTFDYTKGSPPPTDGASFDNYQDKAVSIKNLQDAKVNEAKAQVKQLQLKVNALKNTCSLVAETQQKVVEVQKKINKCKDTPSKELLKDIVSDMNYLRRNISACKIEENDKVFIQSLLNSAFSAVEKGIG